MMICICLRLPLEWGMLRPARIPDRVACLAPDSSLTHQKLVLSMYVHQLSGHAGHLIHFKNTCSPLHAVDALFLEPSCSGSLASFLSSPGQIKKNSHKPYQHIPALAACVEVFDTDVSALHMHYFGVLNIYRRNHGINRAPAKSVVQRDLQLVFRYGQSSSPAG